MDYSHKVPLSITSALVSALLEWVLMFMIFVDASFAYLITRFARHYQLPTPCLLCSRLDHVFGNEGAGFYWHLICHDHKSRIFSLNASSARKCTCGNEPWISHKLLQQKWSYKEGGDHDVSSELDQMRRESTDPLLHVEYSQIKDTSDTESEGTVSGTETAAAACIHETETSDQESIAKFVSESEKPTYSHHNIEYEVPLGHGLEELKWPKPGCSKDVVGPSVLMDRSYVNGSRSIDSKQTNDATIITELEKKVDVECRETSNVGSDFTSTDELWKEVKNKRECHENSKVGSNEIEMDLKSNKTETSLQMAGSLLDLGDAYRLALGARGRQLSGRLEQQRSITDRVSEDLKLLLSQMSAARGLDLSLNDMMSPKVSSNSEDFKALDASGAIGTQVFQRRISLERNESNVSLDGSSVGEIEGENDVDRLKRQVEHDKKILTTLYKELEEERNASAVAANQAMAMITRLQEEKAAFHMEALQFVRMMEEQAEYDSEALQKANELLTEKEKQIQHFQFELEFYRNQFGDAPPSSNFVESESDDLKEPINDINNHEIVETVDGAQKVLDGDMNTLQISLREFEDDKRYILECLKTVEEKLFIFTKNEAYSDMIDQGFSMDELLEARSASDQPELIGSSQENGVTEKNHLKGDAIMVKDVSIYEKSQHEKEEYGKQRFSKDVELAALRLELSVINNRLQALEAEQNVIECSIQALEKGSEGYECVREIAARLHALHSVHIIRREEDST